MEANLKAKGHQKSDIVWSCLAVWPFYFLFLGNRSPVSLITLNFKISVCYPTTVDFDSLCVILFLE